MKGKLFQSLVQTRQQQRLDKHINFFRRLILFFNLPIQFINVIFILCLSLPRKD